MTRAVMVDAEDLGDTVPGEEGLNAPLDVQLVNRFSLSCLMCGRDAGTLVKRPNGVVSFTPPGSNTTTILIGAVSHRCNACNGNVSIAEVEIVRERIEPRWEDDKPRRGRPPRWLVRQRQAEEAARDAAAAS